MVWIPFCFNQGVEPNPNQDPEWTDSFWWTRTEPEPEKFYFSKPEPNLNPRNCAQVNPKPNLNSLQKQEYVIPYPDAAGAGTRTIRAVVIINRISNFSFFSGRNE